MALNFPDTPSNGQVYLGENGIQYTYNLTNDSWTGKLQSSNVPIDPSPSDVSVTPAFGNPSGTNPGSGTLSDPFIITNSVVPTLGGTAESLQTITITNGKAGDQVLFTNNTTPTPIAAKYAQVVGVIDGNGKWTGKLTYNDSLGAETTANITYTGNLQVGNTTVYFRWVVQQQATPPMIVTVGSALTGQALIGTELGATQPTVTGGILPYTYGYQWQTSDNGADFTGILNATSNVYTLVVSDIGKYIRCAATVSDSSTIQIVSITSNTAIVNAMSIDVSLSTTTPKAGDTITATAVTAGGVAPVTTAYQWKADDVNIAGATSTTYTVIEADKDKRLSCLVTTTDTSGTSVSKSSDPTSPVFSGAAPEINTVTLTEVTPDTPDRYTDQAFTVAVDMTSNTPKSDYALRGKVLGDLTVDVSTSIITKLEEQAVDGTWNGVAAPEVNQWGSVTYGAGKFVAVSADGTNRVMYSADGTNWTSAIQATNASWYGVAYGGGKFVAVGGPNATDQQVMYSTDGINWTSTDAVEQSIWFTVAYGAGKFVALSQDGVNQVMYSTDGGLNWTAASAATANAWNSVVYGGGKFVAVSTDATNQVMYSTDGISWLSAQSAEVNHWGSVAYGDGKFVAVASTGTNRVMYSTDGINWIATPATEANFWTSVTYGNGKFVAVSDSGTNQVMYSTDGISWTAATDAAPTEDSGWKTITYGGDKFVSVASYGTNLVMWSYTGTGAAGTEEVLTLTDTTGLSSINLGDTVVQNSGGTPVTTTITNIDTEIGPWISGGKSGGGNTLTYGVPSSGEFAGQGLYVSCPNAGASYSIDGINWIGGTAPYGMWSSVTYGNGVFAAVGVDSPNRCMYSTDGVNWSNGSGGQYTAAAGAGWWSGVTFGNGKFVAVSANGYESNYTNNIMYSTNGSSWTIVSNSIKWASVTYGNGKFVTVGNDDSTKAAYSTNGTSWTNVSVPDNNWYSVAYGNGKYVAVGASAVMYSTDAISWTSGTVTEDVNWESVTYGDGKFVAVGNTGAVMYSYDGISWLAAEAAETNNWSEVTYGGGKFVAITGSGVHPTMWSVDGTGSKIVTLTLANDTNLANFRVGDVTQSGAGIADWSNLFRYQGDANENAVWATGTFINPFKSGDILLLNYQYPFIIDTELLGDYELTLTKNAGSYGNFNIYTNTSSDSTGSIVELAESDSSTTILINNQGTSSYVFSRYITVYGTGANNLNVSVTGKVQFDQFKVTAISESTPSITTDGGSWLGTDGTSLDTWDQSQVWSNGTVVGTSNNVGSTWAKAFNGKLEGSSNRALAGNSTYRLTLTTPITGITKLEIYGFKYTVAEGGSNLDMDVNGTVVANAGTQTSSWIDATSYLGGSTLNSIAVQGNGGIGASIFGIKVNGVLLVDTGVPGAPTASTFVTGPTQAAASGTVKTSGSRNVTAAIQTSVITNVDNNTGEWTEVIPSGFQAGNYYCGANDGAGTMVFGLGGGTGRKIFTSTDNGVTFSSTGGGPSGTTQVYGIAYGNGRFVAAGDQGYYSDNGTSWTAISQIMSGDGSQVQCIGYGAGKFIAGGGNYYKMASSTDGITWSQYTATGITSIQGSIQGIAYGNGVWVCVGLYGIAYSTNGTSWTNISYSSDTFNAIIYAGGYFAIVGRNNSTQKGKVIYSTNGTSWSTATGINMDYSFQIAYGDGTWVITPVSGGPVNSLQTQDISNWSLGGEYTQIPLASCRALQFGNGVFAGGDESSSGKIYTNTSAGYARTILTLTNTTDLARFTPGDVATQDSVNGAPSNGVYFTPNPEGTSAGVTNPADQYYQGNAFDGNTSSAGNFALATPITPITFTNKVEVLPAGEIGKAGINVGLSGETIVGNPGSWDNVWSTVASGGGVIYNFSADPPNSATYAYAWRVDGTIVALTPTDAPGTGIVTASDSVNKTLTMSDPSGVWSANTGNYAVGPVKTTEVAGPYLTLSSSSGRWLVTESDYNSALKLNRFAKSSSRQSVASLFTVMDNSGNISDLSAEDPGYTTMIGDPTYTTTFPSVFPSGQTPDVELPPGTKYQVEVVATNTLGNDNAFSNDVMPVAGLLQTSVITANTLKPGGWNEVAAPSANNFTSIAYDGSGRFVAVSSDGIQRSMYSDDGGSSWAVVNMPGENLWSSVAYGNGYFVAVSRNGTPRAAYASDATSWSGPAGNNTYNIEWYGVAYGAGSFVAVGSNGAMESEDNGASWSQRNYASSGVSGAWKSVVYGTPSTGANAGQGVFVAVSSGTTTMYSLNKGYDWIAGGATTGENFVSVAYNNGIFVAVAENSGSMYSTDGITWTASAADSTSAWRGVTYGGGKFVAVARSGTYRTMHSTDGMSWEYGEAIDSGWNAVVYGGDRYVSVSNDGNTMWSLYGNDSYTELTTADNTNYNLFSAGDEVVESSGGTPVTSAITNVSTAPALTALYYFTGIPTNLADVTTNGVLVTPGLSKTTSQNLVAVVPAGAAPGYSVFSSDMGFTFSWNVNTNTGHFKADGTRLGGNGSYGANEAELIQFGTSADYDTFYRIPTVAAYTVCFNATETGEAADIADYTTLTFTNDTNLANFRVGDQLNGGSGFNPVLYTGNGGSQSVTTTGFSPDFVWLKGYTDGDRHGLYDTVRGPTKRLQSSDTSAEDVQQGVLSFNADNFVVGNYADTNGVGRGYVAWCWDAGNTTVTNNQGSVEAQVRSNGDFSIVKWASVGGTSTFGHGLNSAPKFVITKNTGDASWYCYHESIGYENYLILNATATSAASSWGAAPTDTLFTYGSAFTSGAQNDVIAYCWADSPSQNFGSYTGNGSSRTITCGFQPSFVMIKKTDSTGPWVMVDSERGTSSILYANTSQSQDTNSTLVTAFLTNGFVLGTNSDVNASGGEYIYAAFASSSTITNINEAANQMTFDGDSFTTGESVTGPTFPPATGTISAVDSTNSKLAFSETTGRWLVTQSDYDAAKKLNTKAVVPLVLDAGNSAHVALFNALNTSLTAYPTDKQAFVDALRTKVSGLSLTTPELQVLCTASHTLIKRFVVTVAAYSGSNYFYIDGVRQATLALKKGTTYIFDQDEVTNAGHPLKIYTDANKTTEYTSGVNIVGTPGSALSRTAFLVPTNAPATLYYQCSNHAGMGGQLNIS